MSTFRRESHDFVAIPHLETLPRIQSKVPTEIIDVNGVAIRVLRKLGPQKRQRLDFVFVRFAVADRKHLDSDDDDEDEGEDEDRSDWCIGQVLPSSRALTGNILVLSATKAIR